MLERLEKDYRGVDVVNELLTDSFAKLSPQHLVYSRR